MEFVIDQPTTVTFSNTSNLLKIFFESGEIYHLQPSTNRKIEVKFPDNGTYKIYNDMILGARPGVEKPKKYTLPPQDRFNDKTNFHVVFNPDLKGSPARIFYEKGLCEVGPMFEALPYQFKKFILAHEQGHFFFSDEQAADLYALNQFMQCGYNASQAYFALEMVLKHSQENTERIKTLFEKTSNYTNQKKGNK